MNEIRAPRPIGLSVSESIVDRIVFHLDTRRHLINN